MVPDHKEQKETSSVGYPRFMGGFDQSPYPEQVSRSDSGFGNYLYFIIVFSNITS